MADQFDPEAATDTLRALVQATADGVRALAPQESPTPLFHYDGEGNVMDSSHQILVKASEPLSFGAPAQES